MTKESQTARILKLLKQKGSVTNAELNRICFRYGARIHELRKEGHVIVTNRIQDGLFSFIYRGERKPAIAHPQPKTRAKQNRPEQLTLVV